MDIFDYFFESNAEKIDFPTSQSKLTYLSLCSGIEAASVAWHKLGWTPLGFSEISKFPSEVLKTRFPTVPNFGDMNEYRKWEFERPLDVLIGGTPCQSFSMAGLRAGMADPRGNLALVFLGIVDLFRPRWVIWENVPGVLSSNEGRDFGSFLGGLVELGYGVSYRVLDAQHFGVAQRRRRVFVVGHIRDWRYSAATLFERESLHGITTSHRRSKQRSPADYPRYFTESSEDPTVIDRSFDVTVRETDVAPTLLAREPYWLFDAYNQTANQDVSFTLRCGLGRGDEIPKMFSNGAVRLLTPIECERLQGFPDDWTNIPWRNKAAPDDFRYKAIGNSMAVPVMRWIGNRIATIDALDG